MPTTLCGRSHRDHGLPKAFTTSPLETSADGLTADVLAWEARPLDGTTLNEALALSTGSGLEQRHRCSFNPYYPHDLLGLWLRAPATGAKGSKRTSIFTQTEEYLNLICNCPGSRLLRIGGLRV
jgi:hypothetical protein